MRAIHGKTVVIAVFAVVGACWSERCCGKGREELCRELKNRNQAKQLQKEYEEAKEIIRKINDGGKSIQFISAELFDYLHVYNESPYKWDVLFHAKERFNEKVGKLSPEVFEDVFHAAKKLYKLPRETYNEETFGDNALYWLAPTNSKGVVYDKSSEWLCYSFTCEAVAVKTDHSELNPGAEPFCHNVDANLEISFDPKKDGYPKKVGGNWFLNYKETGKEDWKSIPDSAISVCMKAMDELVIDVAKGEEDWKWDVDIPPFTCRFRPGWGDDCKFYHYKSKSDIYPNGAGYYVTLWTRKFKGSPKEAFMHALGKAKEHELRIEEKREKAVSEADKKRKRNEGKGN